MKNLIFTILLFFPLRAIYSQDTIHVPVDYTSIQAAINASNNGDIVLVADGLYYENINYRGKAITVASHFLVDDNTSHITNTILDGSQPSNPDSGCVVYFTSGEDTTSVICGFTITGGNNGGINCDSSGAKIVNNHIEENENGHGGGINANGSEWIIVEGNKINSNVARGVRISSGEGGGINMKYIQEGRISNNVFSQNLALQREGHPGGGAIHIYECTSLLISNNTIVDNTADGGSGGGLCIDGFPPIILNNIIWGNTAGTDSQVYYNTGNLDIYYSDVQGGWSGVGNIDKYPEFIDTANGDFHLSNSSPCIGAGIDAIEIGGLWYYCPLTDLEGNPRPNPLGSMPDMGAYESPLSVSGIEDYLSKVPNTYLLEQNYPNPFNPSTKIRYSVPQLSNVVIKVFDILGNEIETLVNEEKPAGIYEVEFNSHSGFVQNLPSGFYFCQLLVSALQSKDGKAGNYIETKKMLLIK